MSQNIPLGSQTVGPYFTIGIDYLIDRMADLNQSSEPRIELNGSVLDRDGAPVPDAMLEFWTPVEKARNPGGISAGFRRVGTDAAGSFAVKIEKPLTTHIEDGRPQAPHLIVLIFARGLLRHLVSRVYLEDEPGNFTDPVLLSIPEDRRSTLIAKLQTDGIYHWNVILQGADETAFFAT